jgi:hypothetical protein
MGARLVSIGTNRKFAVAHVTLADGPKVWRSQWALLESAPGGWHVLSVQLPPARNLACKAPADVMRSLAGGCTHVENVPSGTVTGPQDSRPASPSELAAIAKVGRRAIFHGRDGCVTYVAHVSKLDSRFARVAYKFTKPYGNCLLGNGESIYRRTPHGWKDIGDASETFPCTYLPLGVVRSLFGQCRIP